MKRTGWSFLVLFEGIVFFTVSMHLSRGAEAFPTNSFDLLSGQAGKVSYFYDRSLSASSKEIQSAFTSFLTTAQQRSSEVEAMTANVAGLVKEVDAILGVSTNRITLEEQHATLKAILSFNASAAMTVSKTFYILTYRGTKEKLRAGLHIPYFSYDRKNDLATYALEFGGPLIDHPAALITSPPANPSSDFPFFVFPVPDAASAAENLTKYLDPFLIDIRGPALHELIELDILKSVHFADVFFRWFSDGFANAITENVLQRKLGPAAADVFAGYFDSRACTVASNAVTLRWWMPNERLIDPTTVEREAELQKARYVYATELARKIIREAGIDSVRAIIQTLALKTNVYSQDIEEAIHSVTKLDIKSLLDQYQPFASVAEGIQLYTNRVDLKINPPSAAAGQQPQLQKDEKDEIIFNCLRLAELQTAQHHGLEPAFCGHLALFVDGLGASRIAIELMRNQIKLADIDHRPADKSLLQQEFIKFAWNSDSMPVVFMLADDLLKVSPNDPGALSVEMFKEQRAGNSFRAKAIAQKILSDPGADEFFRKKATAMMTQR